MHLRHGGRALSGHLQRIKTARGITHAAGVRKTLPYFFFSASPALHRFPIMECTLGFVTCSCPAMSMHRAPVSFLHSSSRTSRYLIADAVSGLGAFIIWNLRSCAGKAGAAFWWCFLFFWLVISNLPIV